MASYLLFMQDTQLLGSNRPACLFLFIWTKLHISKKQFLRNVQVLK